MKSTLDFLKKKNSQQKISMVTCYDYSNAKAVNESDVDCLLVGDSVAMVVYGFDSTLHATENMIASHTAAVRRGASSKFIVADLPFLTHRMGEKLALETAGNLMKHGANAVKIEGLKGHGEVISHIVGSGIPVMGHLGLTPQSVHTLGGYKVQGRGQTEADTIFDEAKELERLGCFALVLECVPNELAKKITRELNIPVIGIGAGVDVDGQVLVMQDLMGLSSDFKPKFVRTYSNQHERVITSLNNFHRETLSGEFPNLSESYQ